MVRMSSLLPPSGHLSQTSTVASGANGGFQPFHCPFMTISTFKGGKVSFPFALLNSQLGLLYQKTD